MLIEATTITNEPLIYIYNSHDSEKYSLVHTKDDSITPSVKHASYILKDHLNDLGINSIVESKSVSSYLIKNKLNYNRSYEISRKYIKEARKENDFKIIIDLHRDSAKHKYTLYKKDGIKYAKVMFVLTTNHKNYKKNEKFVKKINKMLEKDYKGISRGINKRNDTAFNQDIQENAILLELGGVDNTIDELNNTLKVLAQVFNNYLNEDN